jgi:predicted alpha/beta hydrolase
VSPRGERGEPVRFPALDGHPLPGRWHPATAPRGAVVLCPGVGIPGRFYGRCAEALRDAGLSALTFDYRGVGEARPARLRGLETSLLTWAEQDLGGALAELARRSPGPRFAIGHSFAGQVLGLVPGAAALDAAILVASSAGDLSRWPPLARARLTALMAGVVPLASALWGYVPGWLGLGEDLPGGAAREWARWTLTRGYVAGVLPERIAAGHARLRVPLRVVSPSDDPLGPRGAVELLVGWYRAAPLTWEVIDPASLGRATLGHFGPFRAGAEPLWADWAAWLLAQARTDGASMAPPTRGV